MVNRHNTNNILIQPDDFYTKQAGIEVEADYNFERKDHRAYKGTKMEFDTHSSSKQTVARNLNLRTIMIVLKLRMSRGREVTGSLPDTWHQNYISNWI